MGVCVQTGLALAPHSVSQVQLMVKSLTLCGSALGGLPNTQRVVDFCAQHNIIPRVRSIRHTDLDQVFEQLSHKNDSICRSYHSLGLLVIYSTCQSLLFVFQVCSQYRGLSIEGCRYNKII